MICAFDIVCVFDRDDTRPPHSTPPHPDIPPHTPNTQPAVGVHRTSAAELIAQLLRGGCGALYQPIAEACIIPQLVLLALHHPTNNALQCATLSAIQVC